MHKTGASVWMRVSSESVGLALRAFEFLPDVEITTRTRDAGRRSEVWRLASLDFPAEWEGMEVAPIFEHRVGNGRAILKEWFPQTCDPAIGWMVDDVIKGASHGA